MSFHDHDHYHIHDHTPTLRSRGVLWAGVGLGLVLVAALYTDGFGLLKGSRSTHEPPALMTRQDDKIIVPQSSPLRNRLTIVAAPSEPVGATLLIPAVVESDPAHTASVLPPAGGRVAELKVALGDRVALGQVVAIIDAPDLAQAYEDDEKAADALQLAQKNMERQEQQSKIGALSDRDLDQARSDRAQAAAEYVRTQAHLKVLGASAQQPSLLAVKAPVAGSVTSLAVVPGNIINDPTQSIMTIADLSTIWVTALVPEKDVGAVAKDMNADVTFEAYPGRVLHGKVLFVSDVIEPDSRRDKLRIAFANADYTLKPNMFATVRLAGAKQTRVVLPTSALLMNNDRTSVYVATAPWTFEARVVEPEFEEGETVAIKSGVKPGEMVVTKGGILLND